MLAESWSWPLCLALIYLGAHSAFSIFGRESSADERKDSGLLGTPSVLIVNCCLAVVLGGLLVVTSRAGQSLLIVGIRLWAPIIFFWWAYTWAGQVLHSVHEPGVVLDRGIIRLEGRFLGQPSLNWARNSHPWLTEIFQVFYATYYLYTPIVGIALLVRGRLDDFEAMSFAVLSGYFIAYSCFALLPVWGPRWSLVSEGLLDPARQKLDGFAVTRLMNWIMYQGPALKGGAMPSAHSSTAFVFLVWSWRIWGNTGGVVALVVVVGMWLGSIHGRYHYVLDVVAGALLGLAAVSIADRVYGF